MDHFDVDYHRGFGQLDELPAGLSRHGYAYVSEFLLEVMTLWVEKLFPQGSPFYSNRDDLESIAGSADCSTNMLEGDADSMVLD